jgi:hypothetical protein
MKDIHVFYVYLNVPLTKKCFAESAEETGLLSMRRKLLPPITIETLPRMMGT